MTGPEPSAARPVRGVVCDIDHTLTTQGSVVAIAIALGVPVAEQAALYRRYLARELDNHEARTALRALWLGTGKATRARITDALASVPLREDARPFADFLRARAIPLCLITSSAQLYADLTVRRLGACCGYGNGALEFAADGALSDLDFSLDMGPRKVQQLGLFCRDHGLEPRDVIAVGNGPNDFDLFDATGRGILLTADPSAAGASRAWRSVTGLGDVIALLDGAPSTAP